MVMDTWAVFLAKVALACLASQIFAETKMFTQK